MDNGQEILTSALRRMLIEKKSRNPSYSLRSLAKQIQMSPAALSELLRGKRGISRNRAEKVAERIYLAPELRNQMSKGLKSRGTKINGEISYNVLALEEYKAISEWHHFAILSLAQTKNFKSSPSWIAKRLGLKRLTTQLAIERLLKLGLLEKQNGGTLSVKHKDISSSDGISNPALRKTHSTNLELAELALLDVPLEKRDFSAVTMAIDPGKISEARKLLRKMRDKVSKKLETGNRTEVYKLCIQLFPLTKESYQEH